jgi:dipeptidyl aminopeptidase/acylaminoacyl peptidase
VTRRLLACLALGLLVSGCSGSDRERAEPGTSPTATTPTPSASATTTAPAPSTAPDPVSLPALFEREYDGRGLRLGRELASTASYRQYSVTYRSGDLRISGVLDVPRGTGPFPALVLAHGYIDPEIYQNGQGMRRELDWFGRHGFVTLHVDYRNHAGSDDDPAAERDLRLGYTEDVINAVLALRSWDGPVDDDRVGLVGRSMGGGVVYNVLTVRPGLVDAAVVFAPVSSNAVDSFERWIRPDPGRSGLASRILRRYGEPADNPDFWRNVSPRTFFNRITEPVLIHHGTSDDSCPVRWSRQTAAAMERGGVDVTLRIYPGEEHAFGPQWPLSMDRTTTFLRRQLR